MVGRTGLESVTFAFLLKGRRCAVWRLLKDYLLEVLIKWWVVLDLNQ